MKPKAKMAKPSTPYSNRERHIFRFWDGTKKQAADPLSSLRKLQSFDGLSLKDDLMIASCTQPEFARECEDATERLLKATRDVFGIQPFSEVDGTQSGLTDAETLAVLVEFSMFIGGLAKAAENFPTSRPSSGRATGKSPTPSSSA